MNVLLKFVSDLEEIKKCLGPITDNKTRDLINKKLYMWEDEINKLSKNKMTDYGTENIKFDEHETTNSINLKLKEKK